MDRGVAVVLTAVVGGMVALQGPINSQLGKTIGNVPGRVLLVRDRHDHPRGHRRARARRAAGRSREARTLAPQYLIGGVLGACYVATVLVTVRTLGAGGIVAASIAGQLTMSVVIDQFGLLGLDKDPISVSKAIGVVLLAVGTLLVVRG